MPNIYMSKVAENFFAALDQVGKQLQDFSRLIGDKNEKVFTELDHFVQTSEELIKKTSSQEEYNETNVDKALHEILQNLNNTIKSWCYNISVSKKGQQFMHDHEKYLVVMVFGAVKSGKSTLGNFFAGREWIQAPFDNVYKQRPPTQFATQEKGRDTGDIEKVNNRYWFSEGVTDTTGDIQYFTLSGLRWFDSPGTGALSKKNDKRNMEEMVREYLQYVDLCIFLINSSEPGLMEDMKYMKLLSRAEQEALIVITRSDVIEEDLDDDGNLVKYCVPKAVEQRALQENDMCKRLSEEYPELDAEKFRAMSISSVLAKEAMRSADEKKFKSSQVDLLMQRLTEKAKGNMVEMKEIRPRKAMNKFLQDIIDGDGTIMGIKGLQKNLQTVVDAVETYRQEINKRTQVISQQITRQVKAVSNMQIFRLANQTEVSGQSVTQEEIAEALFKIAYPIVAKEINQAISVIIGNSRGLVDDLSVKVTPPDIQSSGIQQHTEQIVQHYQEIEVVDREPDGVWEHICGFFGRQYYQQRIRDRVKTSTVVTGTNIAQVIEELMPQIEDYVRQTVRDNLENIGENYFAPQEKFVQVMQIEMNQLCTTLESLRF